MVATATRPGAPAKPAPLAVPDSLPKWSAMLAECLDKPGTMHAAYSSFHDYSMGNMVMALMQCASRGIAPGPLASYGRWIQLKRQVRKGEKALWLWQPVTIAERARGARADSDDDAPADGSGKGKPTGRMIQVFILKPRWFVLSQTDGDAYAPPPPAEWDADMACTALGVKRESFAHLNGNSMGYASADGTVAVNPLAFDATKTLIHELAHQTLGHLTREPGVTQDRALREVEAEATAYLVGDTLGLTSGEYSRGYVQHWAQVGGYQTISETAAKRIFGAAQRILAAGRPAKSAPTD